MDSEKLKPCPMCGSEAVYGENRSPCGRTVRIDCTNPECGANVNCFDSKKSATKAWNQRADNHCEKCNGSDGKGGETPAGEKPA